MERQPNRWITLILRVLVIVLFVQTLWFKFAGAPESVYIFSTLGVEPVGRIFTGIMELVASLLLIFRKTLGWGILLAIGIISGALLSHLFILGIEVQEDGGLLFGLAIIIWVSCLVLFWIYRRQDPVLIRLWHLLPFG